QQVPRHDGPQHEAPDLGCQDTGQDDRPGASPSGGARSGATPRNRKALLARDLPGGPRLRVGAPSLQATGVQGHSAPGLPQGTRHGPAAPRPRGRHVRRLRCH
ncbi:hypothetical protein BN1708_019658, partial [Verticillium longisporum]